MITLTFKSILLGILAICAGFTTICVAVGWLIKIIKAVKKPSETIKDKFDGVDLKLDNDNKRIKELEAQSKYITDAISVLMRCDLAMLAHMRTANNTGQLAEMESAIQNFLLKR